MLIPKVGERWRWSYCDGPDWCCGGEGVIQDEKIDANGHYFEVITDDATGIDEFDPDDVRSHGTSLSKR